MSFQHFMMPGCRAICEPANKKPRLMTTAWPAPACYVWDKWNGLELDAQKRERTVDVLICSQSLPTIYCKIGNVFYKSI